MVTPRFNLDTYQQGDTDWSHTDTVEFVDEYGIDRGTLANRPSSGTYDDELYYAEDQGLLYQWDSGTSSWDTASFGSQSNPVPDTSYFDGLDANEFNSTSGSVESQPTSDTDIVRKLEADSKADLTGPDGVLQSSQVPDLSITSTYTVTDSSARLSLDVQEGDVAIQTDNNTTYIFTGGDPSVDSNWSEIQLDVLEAIDGSDITPSSVSTQSVSTGELTTDRSSLVVPLLPMSVPSGSETVLELSDTAVVNQLTGLDAANNQWVAPNDMTVSLCTIAQWNDATTEPTDGDTVTLAISVNGDEVTEFRSESQINRFENIASPTVDAEVSQGDTIDVRITQDTGSTADIASTTTYRNYLRIRRV